MSRSPPDTLWPAAGTTAGGGETPATFDRAAARAAYRQELQKAYEERLAADAERMRATGVARRRYGYQPVTLTIDGITVELRVPRVELARPVEREFASGGKRLVRFVTVPAWTAILAEVDAEQQRQVLERSGSTRDATASTRTGRRQGDVGRTKVAEIRGQDRADRASAIQTRPLHGLGLALVMVDGTNVGGETILVAQGTTF